MRQEPKNVSETQAIADALDEKIAKLTQMRELLADPGIVVLVREIFHKSTTPTVRILSGAAAPHLRRPLARTAYEAVQAMDGPFTKVDVAERMKEMAVVLIHEIHELGIDPVFWPLKSANSSRLHIAS